MRRRGLSLVEVIIAMVLVGLMATVTLGTMLACAQPQKQMVYREQAIQRAAAEFARRKAQNLPVGVMPASSEQWEGVLFTTSIQVEAVPSYDPRDLRKLTVKVVWKSFSTEQSGWVSGTTF